MKFYVDNIYRDRMGSDFVQLTVQLVAQGSYKETKAFADELRTGEVEVTAVPGAHMHKQGNRIFDVAEQRYVADCTTNEAAEAALRLLK